MKDLSAMARWVTEYIENHFVDQNGLVRSCISMDGGRLKESDNEGLSYEEYLKVHSENEGEKFTPLEQREYENSGMATGAYMVSQVLRYKLTGEAEALKIVKRCYQSIRFVLELGKELEYGFFPKPWGGRFSIGTSTDQVLYTIYGLDAYYPLAAPAERREIEIIITKLVDFWVKRDYRFSYLFMKDMTWPPLRFPSLLYIASHYSGEERFRIEAERILQAHHLDMPENSRIKKERDLNPYETENKIKIVYAMGDSVAMDVMNSVLMLRYGYAQWRDELLEVLRTMWWEGKQDIAPDGSCWSTLYLDLENGKLRSAIDPNYSFYFNGARMGWSTMILRGGLQCVEYCPELKDEVLEYADWVLPTFDDPKRFFYVDPQDVDCLEPERKHVVKVISGDSIANWMWSYWLREEYR